MLAYRRDGGIMERNSRREWHNYVVLESEWDTAQIKFPKEQRSIRMDHGKPEYSELSEVRGGLPVWDLDQSSLEVVSARIGEPDAVLFQVPQGYRRVR